MLTTVEAIQAMPGLLNQAIAPTPWVNQLIGGASKAITTYLKRDIELQAYTEYYDGTNQRDIICRQFPVWAGQAHVAAGSNGAVLPQATINVDSTAGFNPGTNNVTTAHAPALAIQTGVNSFTVVHYTGTTATTFTGCTGGTGTLSSSAGRNKVFAPIVFFDQGGFSGQAENAFGDGTIMTMGSNFMVQTDSGGTQSHRGLLRRTGGAASAFIGFYPENFYSGKLSAYREPAWPRGNGNIKVMYSAGYWPIPFDIQYACGLLVAYMIRTMPYGYPLQSETLGAYSYTVMQLMRGIPELGSLFRTLAPYRETSWGAP